MTITFICGRCGESIAAGAGSINLYDAELDAAEKAWADHEALQAAALRSPDPLAGAFSPGELMRLPRPARWRPEHARCEAGRAAYWVEVDRLTSELEALDWTVHLMGKPWIQYTDWDQFVRRHVLRPAQKGVSA